MRLKYCKSWSTKRPPNDGKKKTLKSWCTQKPWCRKSQILMYSKTMEQEITNPDVVKDHGQRNHKSRSSQRPQGYCNDYSLEQSSLHMGLSQSLSMALYRGVCVCGLWKKNRKIKVVSCPCMLIRQGNNKETYLIVRQAYADQALIPTVQIYV